MTQKALKAFYYQNDLYLRAVPAKALFNSTLIHEVVNRGDVFALRLSDQKLTIIPGKASVTFIDLPLPDPALYPTTQIDDLFPESLSN